MILVIAAFVMVTTLSVVSIVKLEAERKQVQFKSLKRMNGTFAE